MSEFKSKKRKKVKGVKTIAFIFLFLTSIFAFEVFILDRSLLNYGIISLAFFAVWTIKKKNEQLEVIHKNAEELALVIDNDKIIFKKNSRLSKEFPLSKCSLFVVNSIIFFKANKKCILQCGKERYYVGALENSEELLREAHKLNLNIEEKNQHLLIEMFTILAVCIAAIADLYDYVLLSNMAFIATGLFGAVIFYRLLTKFYIKNYVTSKEKASWFMTTQFNYLAWGLCCSLSFLALTPRDQSLDALDLTIAMLKKEKDKTKKEKLVVVFNEKLSKFKRNYPDDLAVRAITKRFDKYQKREIASDKKE